MHRLLAFARHQRWGILGIYPARELLRPLLYLQIWQFLEKGSRLLVIVVLARAMDALELGIIAIAFSSFEVLKALSQNGAAQRVAAAQDANLAIASRQTYAFQRNWILAVVAIQLACALLMAKVFDQPLAALMLTLLTLEYLALPRISVSLGRALREVVTREKVAHVSGIQNVVSNMATLALLLSWPHPLALVAARILAIPVFYFGIQMLAPWRPDNRPAPAQPGLARFTTAVTLSELAKASRMHLDKVLIGGVLGLAALGEYFFAFSAGLGLANSLSVALGTALFPFLATAQDRRHALFYALRLTMFSVVPIVALQAYLAPVYVPFLFGEKWAHLHEVVSILCLAAIPGTMWSAIAQYLRSIDKAWMETAGTLVQSATTALITVLIAPYGLVALGWGYLFATSAVTAAFAVPILWQLRQRPAGGDER